MSGHGYGTSMTDDEIAQFLYDHGIGVLSLSRNGHSYGIPVSYGYDGDCSRCILDLGFAPESKKETFLETTEQSCLTVYEWRSPTDWRSVVMTGELRELDGDLEADLEQRYYEHADDVEIAVFDRPPEMIELQWFEFSIDELSGRTSRST
ncbi:pyridoxamine 5'-phosphate oxidase family protein [Natronorubrum sp. A-ect3]|uniref:pyridoxamine 5'-phosphate oxidase family protein n=1 Tax=Natronorubrum sp. A-ect3 TaxID=3242698 RepID=UPI00359D82E7